MYHINVRDCRFSRIILTSDLNLSDEFSAQLLNKYSISAVWYQNRSTLYCIKKKKKKKATSPKVKKCFQSIGNNKGTIRSRAFFRPNRTYLPSKNNGRFSDIVLKTTYAIHWTDRKDNAAFMGHRAAFMGHRPWQPWSLCRFSFRNAVLV